jgi:glycosyltransferase involved in cell wall biosynthesis
MHLSAIILTYNRPDALELVLKSIQYQQVFPDEVIIADDGSGPDTREIIDRFRINFPVRLEHVWQEDQGYRIASIRNRAILISEGDYLVFSDGDLVFHPKFFSDFKNRVTLHTAFIGSRVFLNQDITRLLLNREIEPRVFSFISPSVESNRINAIRIPWLWKWIPRVKNTANMRGALLGVWKSELLAVNGWNEAFTGWGLEDTEFVARLWHSGVTIRKLKFAGIAFHLWHPAAVRDQLERNRKLLDQTLHNRSTWCSNGLIKGENP